MNCIYVIEVDIALFFMYKRKYLISNFYWEIDQRQFIYAKKTYVNSSFFAVRKIKVKNVTQRKR